MAAKELYYTPLANDASLEGYWRLESDGTDTHANGNDLTDTGSPTHTTGKFGNGVDLESGTPDYLSIVDGSQTGLDIPGDISISAWIKVESLGSNRPIVSKYDTGDDKRQYRFGIDADGKLEMNASDDGTADGTHFIQWKTDDNVISTGTWYHVVYTLDISSETCVAYVGGVAKDISITIGTTLGVTLHNGTAPFFIGQDFNGGISGNDFDGIIDDVAIFSRVLTAAEIANLHAGTFSKPKGVILV